MSIMACEEGCASHSAAVHDAIRTLRAYQPTRGSWSTNEWNQEFSTWTLVPTVSPEPGGMSWPVLDPAQGIGRTPVARTMRDQELLMIFVNFMSQFTASLEGNPDPSNPYIKHYVSYILNSQLLAHVAIYSAACFLTDAGLVERNVAMAHKGRVFKLLNEHIRSQVSASDEVIAGVLQIILDEWLWGNTDDLLAHLRGIRDMIRLRGGFRTLGLQGMLSKLAICTDVAIALSLEVPPFLRGGAEFEFRDNSPVPLRLALNTPLVSTLVRFSSCADALRIHPAVASILDDMRFLLAAVLALPANPSAKELQKVHTTSAWIYERILSLPENSPTTRPPSSPASSTPNNDSSMAPETFTDSQSRTSPQQAPRRPRRTQAQTPTATTIQTGPAAAPPAQTTQTSPETGTTPPDHVYQAVRLAALLYSRAIMHRRPFSRVVAPDVFLRLWTTVWRVPLSTWRSLLGVFAWVLVPIAPRREGSGGSGGGTAQPHDRFVKGLLRVCLFQMGMDSWEVAGAAMESGLQLQRWLAGEAGDPAEVGPGGGSPGSQEG
ncbi:hypothetical protein C7999DRAFT_43755 [Corynascus novoguineensis]|uniref:Uncharacterized protein n=1 Tax=Corynascus novoguineensis TaxID=1126955 RepID=A0AAN7HJX7_9PEZI|nr:hypothetical protein C7999DRAFT_43755 [Corynascus novoguineensis]